MSTDDELLGSLGDALAEPGRRPPEDRVARLRAQVDGRARPPSFVPGGAPLRRAPSRRAPLVLAAAAAVAVVLGAGVGLSTVLDSDDGEPVAAGVVEFDGRLVAPAGGEGALAVVRMIGEGRVVALETDELAILPAGEYYELWFVGPGDSEDSPNRISAGTFHPDPEGRTDVTFQVAVDPAKYPTMSITSEPGDGDPARTGPEVLRATIGAS